MFQLLHTLLNSPWLAVPAFAIGMLIGFLIARYYYRKHIDHQTKIQKAIISVIVFSLWTGSVLLDIYNGVNNTSVFLHIFAGAVIGAANREFGEWILKFWKKP